MTNVLLADDDARYRRTLRDLLNAEADIEVVGEAENGTEAISEVERLMPDVLLVDVKMPQTNGIEVTRRVHSAHPEIRVIAVSMYAERMFAEAMRAAGASAYLRKDEPFSKLCAAIRRKV